VLANSNLRKHFQIFFLLALLIQIAGCVSEDVKEDGIIGLYQKQIVEKSPQLRNSNWGLESLRPSPEADVLKLNVSKDEATGKNIVNLSIDDAVRRMLVSSPEISIVSYNPSIAKEDVVKAAADFDPALFGRVNYDKQDDPANSTSMGGQADQRLWKTGIKQKGVTGAEWSLAYGLSRNWDNLTSTTLSTRYEPALSFQIKQPLLRDAWKELNLAGVNISKLNYRVAFTSFRQKTEEVSAEVISLYWTLARARRDREIQQWLLDRTNETLKKVEDRKGIDATDVQIKQTEAAVKSREAVLLQAEKQVLDVQDALVRLLSDSQINLLSDYEIVPTSALDTAETRFEQSEILKIALENNPIVQQARLIVDVAQINVDVAKRQKMPKLDLVASSRLSGLDRGYGSANNQLGNSDFGSYAVGITFEIPLGNRQREAEYRKRKWEKRKANSILQNTSDKLAVQVKGRIRLADTAYDEIQVQKDAVDAAKLYLRGIEDTEIIREKLTPEFLLVKLQSQEALSNAQRSEIKAISDYNIAQIRLAQSMGTVLDMRYVRKALPRESE
jgi:outer membrane protein TolC